MPSSLSTMVPYSSFGSTEEFVPATQLTAMKSMIAQRKSARIVRFFLIFAFVSFRFDRLGGQTAYRSRFGGYTRPRRKEQSSCPTIVCRTDVFDSFCCRIFFRQIKTPRRRFDLFLIFFSLEPDHSRLLKRDCSARPATGSEKIRRRSPIPERPAKHKKSRWADICIFSSQSGEKHIFCRI